MADANPLQKVLDRIPDHFHDAIHLDLTVEQQLASITERRREIYGRGNGAPPRAHKTLNRAVIVAAVGGMEAFYEDLAQVSRNELLASLPKGLKEWYVISGSRGEIQTPSPRNIRKLYWSLFHIDLQDYWSASVTTSASETGGSGTWRISHGSTLAGQDVSKFLMAMVGMRHVFAHGDSDKKIDQVAGIVGDKKSVQSHHAFNSVSTAIQVSMQSIIALSNVYFGDCASLWWRKGWNDYYDGLGLAYWIAGTPVSSVIESDWRGHYPSMASLDVADEVLIAEGDANEDTDPYSVS